MIGKTLDGRYKLERLLGEGGMGSVYEAVHLGTGRRVAVKLIQSIALGDTDVMGRFQREARASGAIDTRHIVEVLDSGRDPESNLPYLAMDLLRGEDLGALIARRGALPVDLALRIASQACVGLGKAHKANVIHRDIKPANLFLAEEEDHEVVVKVLDFGIAKVRPQNPLENEGVHLTQTGRLLGTPLYMSPEQAQGFKDLDYRTDIWSLGGVLYEALTGRSPHHHADNLGKLILAICGKRPPSPSSIVNGIPAEVDAIVMRALAIERAERYATAEDMLRDITALLPDGDDLSHADVWAGDRPAPPSPAPRGKSKRASGPAPLELVDSEVARSADPGKTRKLTVPAPSQDELGDTRAVEDVGVASTLYAVTADPVMKKKRARTAALAIAGLSVAAALVGGFVLTNRDAPSTDVATMIGERPIESPLSNHDDESDPSTAAPAASSPATAPASTDVAIVSPSPTASAVTNPQIGVVSAAPTLSARASAPPIATSNPAAGGASQAKPKAAPQPPASGPEFEPKFE